MSRNSLINNSYSAEHFFLNMGMFFYAELIREMRNEIMRERELASPMKTWKA